MVEQLSLIDNFSVVCISDSTLVLKEKPKSRTMHHGSFVPGGTLPPDCFMAESSDSDSSEYNQKSKRQSRSELIEHAVRCLTTERSTSVCVKRDHVARVWQQLLESGEANKYFKEEDDIEEIKKEIKKEIDQWELLHDSKVQKREPSDLRVCFLGGENPKKDLRVLVKNGVLCQNVWAVEKSSKKAEKAWNKVKESKFKNVKLVKKDIVSFWKVHKEPFDIIYLDACGSLPSIKQETLKAVGCVFLHNMLTSPGALITNFSFPQKKSASSQHVSVDKEREMINFLVKGYMEYRLCNAMYGHDLPEINAECLEDKKDEDNYGDYVSFQVIDSAYLFIPAQKLLSSKWKSLWGQMFVKKEDFLQEINGHSSAINSHSSANVEGTTNGTDEEITKKTRNQELMAAVLKLQVGEKSTEEECKQELMASLKELKVDEEVHSSNNLFSYLKRMAETFLEKSNNRCCKAWDTEIFPDWKSDPSLKNEKIPSMLLTPLLFSSPIHIMYFSSGNFVLKCLRPLFDAVDKKKFPIIFYDATTFEQATCLVAGLFYGQTTYPSFPVMDKLFRLRYTAKKRQMFADVFVFDKCRYLYEHFPTVDRVCFAEEELKQQFVVRMVVDGLRKHLGGICEEDLFRFCHVASIDEITNGGVSFPDSERSIPERQKIEERKT